MNPYTYKKRRVDSGSAQNPQVGDSSKKGSWLNAIVNAKLSSAIAFAFVIFAAGTVASLASVAVSESAVSDAVASSINMVSHIKPARVLGESITQTIIDDSALEAGNPSGAILAKPVSFDAVALRWNYSISYSVANLTDSATLTIGTYVLQNNILSSGTLETGAILKPNMTYQLSLWIKDSSGYKQNLAHFELKTQTGEQALKSKISPVPPVCLNLAPSTTTPINTPSFCIKKDDGSTQCVPRPCALGTFNPDSSSNGASSTLPPIIIKGSSTPAHVPLIPYTQTNK